MNVHFHRTVHVHCVASVFEGRWLLAGQMKLAAAFSARASARVSAEAY